MHSAAFLYGIVLLGCASANNLMLLHLVHSSAFEATVAPSYIRATVVAYRVAWLTYLLATAVSLFLPRVSFGLYLLIALYFVVPRGVDDDLLRRS